LHAYPYSSKFPAFVRKREPQFGDALAQERGGGATGCGKHQLGGASVNDRHSGRKHRGQRLPDALLDLGFALPSR
jgi:hypothetical protein